MRKRKKQGEKGESWNQTGRWRDKNTRKEQRNLATETKPKGKGNKLREILSFRWREEEG